MRVQFIIPSALSNDDIIGGFAKGLKDALCPSFDIEAVNEHPNLIHVFGAWQTLSTKTLEDAHRRRIPIVFSPLGGLTPWTICHHDHAAQKAQKQAVRWADIVHAAGPEEQKAVLHWAENRQRVIILPIPVITATTTFQQVAKAFSNEYKQMSDAHDQRITEEIARQTEALQEKNAYIRHIVSATLYLHYWYGRGTLPSTILNELADYLITHDYDEDAIPSILDAVGMRTFFQQLLQVLSDITPLTEGFMPLPAVNDKQSKAMRLMVFPKPSDN